MLSTINILLIHQNFKNFEVIAKLHIHGFFQISNFGLAVVVPLFIIQVKPVQRKKNSFNLLMK